MNKKQGLILLSIGIIIIFGGCTNNKQTLSRESSSGTTVNQSANQNTSSNETTGNEGSGGETIFLSASDLLDKMKADESYIVISSPENSKVEKYYQDMLADLSEKIRNNFYFIESKEMKGSEFYKEIGLEILGSEYDDGVFIYIKDGTPKAMYSKSTEITEKSTDDIENLFK